MYKGTREKHILVILLNVGSLSAYIGKRSQPESGNELKPCERLIS